MYFGRQVESEDNILRDGTLIDLCGSTLLWRSALGLLHAPVSTRHKYRHGTKYSHTIQ